MIGETHAVGVPRVRVIVRDGATRAGRELAHAGGAVDGAVDGAEEVDLRAALLRVVVARLAKGPAWGTRVQGARYKNGHAVLDVGYM